MAAEEDTLIILATAPTQAKCLVACTNPTLANSLTLAISLARAHASHHSHVSNPSVSPRNLAAVPAASHTNNNAALHAATRASSAGLASGNHPWEEVLDADLVTVDLTRLLTCTPNSLTSSNPTSSNPTSSNHTTRPLSLSTTRCQAKVLDSEPATQKLMFSSPHIYSTLLQPLLSHSRSHK